MPTVVVGSGQWFWMTIIFIKSSKTGNNELEPLNHSRFLETETSQKSQSVY